MVQAVINSKKYGGEGVCAVHPVKPSVNPLATSWGHGGRVVTLSPPTEARVRFRARPQVGKLVVVCHWSAVYSTEP